jgi:hypothetical protein
LFVVGGLNNQSIFIFVIKDALVRRVLDHSLPRISIEVGQVVAGCGNGGKPIVEDDMELWNYVACLGIENEGDRESGASNAAASCERSSCQECTKEIHKRVRPSTSFVPIWSL